MSFIATLQNNTKETNSFKNISDIYMIKTLETDDFVPVRIDFETGEIFVNHKHVEVLSDYVMPHAKPIQYKKVVQEINMANLDEITLQWEEQYLGYSYKTETHKVKLELCCNDEIKSVAAFIESIDLRTNEKQNKVIRLY